VGQVVARLLDIVNPDFVYVGQKDFQQCIVIRNLISLLGKENEISLTVCPTIREADGLAMSSRNRRLTEPQRALAGLIYQCLVSIQAKQMDSSFKIVQKECMDLLEEKGFLPEYVSLADAADLSLLEEYDKSKKMVALIAARLGDVRLIDNMVIN
jgi:pantoate--beta-alanine ligase